MVPHVDTDTDAPEEADTTTAATFSNEQVTTNTSTSMEDMKDIEIAEEVVDNNDVTIHDNHHSIFTNKHPNDLQWAYVNMVLKDKKGESQNKHILDNVWGEAKAGKTTAIMGASGAGKTSLFQTLAGRVSSGGKITVESDNIYLGGTKINPMDRDIRRLFAYVAQHDALHESSTPRESLHFSAKLRLPKTTTHNEIDKLVNNCIAELGLTSCCDTMIGGKFKKGISGGEKRRVSIGIELVASPSILFLDEPTSGLDSYAAGQVMKLLAQVAKAGKTVLFTIHQPSSDVFCSFDRLILLNKGRVMHQGAVATICDDFSTLGYTVPPNYNPADWLLDVAQINSVEELERQGFFGQMPAGHLANISSSKQQQALDIPDRQHVSQWTEFQHLQKREAYTLYRNPQPMMINVGATSFLAVIFGVIFFGVGREDRAQFSAVQSQLGAIVNIMISTLMGQSNTALFIFAAERPVFLREYSSDHYAIVPYFLAHLCSEALQSFSAILAQALISYWMIGFQMAFWQYFVITYCLAMTATAVSVMLGAFFEDTKSAASLFPLVIVPQFYFSGLFISIEFIPVWVRWAQYLCSMTHGSRLAFAYEFTDCDPGQAADNCMELLNKNQVSKDDTWWYWLALLGLFCAFRLGGIYVLHSKAYY